MIAEPPEAAPSQAVLYATPLPGGYVILGNGEAAALADPVSGDLSFLNPGMAPVTVRIYPRLEDGTRGEPVVPRLIQPQRQQSILLRPFQQGEHKWVVVEGFMAQEVRQESEGAVSHDLGDGVYALAGNGTFRVPSMPQALANTGARDCTMTIYAAEDVLRCPCMVHEGKNGVHAAGTVFGQFTIFAGTEPDPEVPPTLDPQSGALIQALRPRRTDPGKFNYIPDGHPLVVRVDGFTPGTLPVAQPEEPRAFLPPSNPYDARTDAQVPRPVLLRPTEQPPRPQETGAMMDEMQRKLRAAYEEGLAMGEQQAGAAQGAAEASFVPPPELVRPAVDWTAHLHPRPERDAQPAALFPGFIVTCERCGSTNVSLDMQSGGKAYLECEECGAMCRLKLGG